MTDTEKIYVRFRGRTLGPLTSQKVQDLIARGQITRLHELSGDGLSWSKAEEFGEFFAKSNEVVATEDRDLFSSESTTANSPTGHSAVSDEASVVDPQAEVDLNVEWYFHVDGENRGPVSRDVLRDFQTQGRLMPATLVWRSGLETWQAAEKVLPELFNAGTSTGLPQSYMQPREFVGRHSADDFSLLAEELNRRRGWAFFFGIVLIVVSSVQNIIHVATVFAATSGSATGANTTPALVTGVLGIAFSGTIMTAGILLLQFCGRARDFLANPSQNSALLATKRLNTLWSFLGISSLIWLAIFTSIAVILFSIGRSVIEALS